MRNRLKLLLKMLILVVAVVALTITAFNIKGNKNVSASQGDETYKVGMQVKVIDQFGRPVEGVSFKVTMLTYRVPQEVINEFTLGPSDKDGIARSAPDAVQLYENEDEFDYHRAPSNIFAKDFLKNPSITISVTDYPEEYTKPIFDIPYEYINNLPEAARDAYLGYSSGIGLDLVDYRTGEVLEKSEVTYSHRFNFYLYPAFDIGEGYLSSEDIWEEIERTEIYEADNFVLQPQISDGMYFSAIGYSLSDDAYDDIVSSVIAPITFKTQVPDVKYNVEYSYEGDLPKEVMDTLPISEDTYSNGEEVTPIELDEKSVYVKSLHKTYTFNGWQPSSVIVNGENAKFTGTWSAEDDSTYKVKYYVNTNICY